MRLETWLDHEAMKPRPSSPQLSEHVYQRIKDEIFDFRLLPGDSFTESELAARMGVSRTPVREALVRLSQEGYVELSFRRGWRVPTLDFERFDELYDLRVILETAAVRKLCAGATASDLDPLNPPWMVPVEERVGDGQAIARLDEAFHAQLVAAAGNREMSRMHREITERIRIIRRLDFTQSQRIQDTYQEHAKILRAILQRRVDQALLLLRSHIETSKAEVRKITLHMLHSARMAHAGANVPVT